MPTVSSLHAEDKTKTFDSLFTCDNNITNVIGVIIVTSDDQNYSVHNTHVGNMQKYVYILNFMYIFIYIIYVFNLIPICTA